MKAWIGIDPGLRGAVAVLSDTQGVLALIDTPTTVVKSGKKNKTKYIEAEMVKILAPFNGDVHVGIELVHSMPGQGVSSMFSMGYGFGLWIGIVSAFKLPYTLITPQKWKKAMMDGTGKEKAASCHRAQQLYPDEELFTPRGRALDGRGDAILIAHYLMTKYNNT